MYRRKKSRAKHDKSIRKFIYLNGIIRKDCDILDNFFKIASNILYGETEIFNKKLQEDKILNEFYQANQEELKNFNSDTMLLRLVHSSFTHKIPLVSDKTFLLNECSLSGKYKLKESPSKHNKKFSFTESLNDDLNKEGLDPSTISALKTIESFFTEMLEIIDEENQNIDIFFELFDSELQSKITFVDEELMLDNVDSRVNTLFLEKLFLFYGPELIFETCKFLNNEENLKKYNTEEYANCLFVFINASLKAASYMDEKTFDQVFDLIFNKIL